VYARSTTIQASPGSIDRGIAFMRDEVMPAVMGMDGCIGLSLLVDRSSGRCIATTAWESEQAMRATSAGVQRLRDEATTAFDAEPVEVQEWEIASLHRQHESHEGTCVRVSWLTGDPSRLESGIEAFRTRVVPKAEELEGFCSASLMVDRGSGRMAGSTAWDDRRSMEASRSTADKLRTDTATDVGGQIQDVGEFELAIAHLRVPELV
jgi:quinol monooxygenase YgiN